MTLPRVRLCAPVRNRAWILPRYLRALEGLEYPPSRLMLHWVVNDSSDDTEGILRAWREMRGGAFGGVLVERIDFGARPNDTHGADRIGGARRAALPILAALRNHLREAAVRAGDWMFSVDSDILVRPDTLSRLLRADRDVVAALVVNGRDAWNFLHYDPQEDRFKPPESPPGRGLFPVGVTGAVCLYSPRACFLGAFAVLPDGTGEDEGMARSLAKHGIEMWLDGGAECDHIMEGPRWR